MRRRRARSCARRPACPTTRSSTSSWSWASARTRSRRLSLVPLIAVAWADGEIQDNERTAILQGAHGKGLEEGTAGYELPAELAQ